MRLRKPSPAMLVALLALFVALGGSSYAAVVLSKNSVRSKHIVKGNVKRSDLGKNAVNSSKVADASLLATDFASGQLPSGPKGDTGATGAAGAPGAPGAPGDTGPPGISGLETVSGTTGINTGDSKFSNANCPAGKQVIAGGATIIDNSGPFGTESTGSLAAVLVESRPNSTIGWWATGVERIATSWGVRTYAVCANVAP